MIALSASSPGEPRQPGKSNVMKLLAAALLALSALLPQPASAQPLKMERVEGPSEAMIDRFLAVLPDRGQIDSIGTEIDSAELGRLVALNPGKEVQVRAVLQANLACSGPAVTAGTLRMLRTVARNLGRTHLEKLTGFYAGPDYATFAALAARMEGNANPSAEDKAAMAKLMGTYPLQAFQQEMSRANEIIAADQDFMSAAIKCASEQVKALTAAGLKAN